MLLNMGVDLRRARVDLAENGSRHGHRAFARYGLEVPEKSAAWARNYVGQWIMKDKADGIAICPLAAAFALGQRSPHDPLPAVDGNPKHDFSKRMER